MLLSAMLPHATALAPARMRLLAVALAALVASCTEQPPVSPPLVVQSRVTFIELGSEHCVPCQEMRVIMRSLEGKYGSDQLTLVFYDLMKDPSRGEVYNVRVMPTQVFLDHEGREFHRHEGFYAEASIDSLLAAQGLRILPGR